MAEVHRYRNRVSGPLLDRIDLQVETPALRPAELRDVTSGESSADVRTRVERARGLQLHRFAGRTIVCNAQMGARELRRHCVLDAASERLLDAAIERLSLSARSYGRILKIARTIADLAGDDDVRAGHVAEAIQYRSLDAGA